VKGNVIDVAACNSADPNQSFTFDGSTITTSATTAITTSATTVAITGAVSTTSTAVSSTAAAATTAAPSASGVLDFNPTTPVPVSRAGGELQPSAVAEAQQFDNTATRAFTGVSLKASNGQCLFIDPTAGDFRENLIPVALQDCNGGENEKFDLITQGKNNNANNSTLIVSSLVSDIKNISRCEFV
jgi:hypothetical protein